MSTRLAMFCSLLLASAAQAQPVPGPPEDLWAELMAVPPTESWLSRITGCATAAAELFGPFRPYPCFPPLASTVGVHPTGVVLSFESESQPACGDALPSRLERWSAARPGVVRVDLTERPAGTEKDSDQAIAGVLATVFAEGMKAQRAGFLAPSPATEAAALRAGDAALQAALVLGPPHAGKLVWLDFEGQRVMWSTPSRTQVLGRLPVLRAARGKARPSLVEAVATPQRRLIVRIEGLSGTPCDPAALARLVFELPNDEGPGSAWPLPLGETMRRCQGGERGACERLCDAGHCRPLARLGGLSASRLEGLARACRRESALDCAALSVLAQETCRREGQDSEGCRTIEALIPMPVMVKGGPPSIPPWQRLARACEHGETESCRELVTRFPDQPFRIPRDAAVKAHKRLVEQLTWRCGMSESACRALEDAKRQAP